MTPSFSVCSAFKPENTYADRHFISDLCDLKPYGFIVEAKTQPLAALYGWLQSYQSHEGKTACLYVESVEKIWLYHHEK